MRLFSLLAPLVLLVSLLVARGIPAAPIVQDGKVVPAVQKHEWAMQEEHILHSVGQARGKDEWEADVTNHAYGHLQYGPYVTTLPAGTMVASWDLMIDNNTAPDDGGPVVTLDIYDGTAGKIIAIQDIKRTDFRGVFTYQTFTLPFDLPSSAAGHAIEARVFWHRKAYIRERRVDIAPRSIAMMYWTAAELPHHIGEPYGGFGWCAYPGKHLPEALQYGPYTDKIAPGNYVASFALMTDQIPANPAQTIVTLDAYDATAGKILAARVLNGKAWEKPGVFAEFPLRFTLEKEGAHHQIELRVHWSGSAFVAENSVRLDPAP